MTPSIYYPLRYKYINQHFGGNLSCVKDFGLPTQTVVTGTQTTCPVGYEKLYQRFGMAGHNGLDLACREWPVYAATDGVVVEKQDVPARGLGLGILSHEQYDFPEGRHYLKLRYWHLKSFNVEVGQSVKVGDMLGITNNTGYSSGDHLHLEGQLMDKDTGGHPILVQLNNGYANAINIEPYFNGEFAYRRFIFNRNLWIGMSNSDVLELQERLGIDYSTGPGKFGPRTFLGVVQYQKARGISPTGFVGPITRASLNK